MVILTAAVLAKTFRTPIRMYGLPVLVNNARESDALEMLRDLDIVETLFVNLPDLLPRGALLPDMALASAIDAKPLLSVPLVDTHASRATIKLAAKVSTTNA
jgi:hypothetical protein